MAACPARAAAYWTAAGPLGFGSRWTAVPVSGSLGLGSGHGSPTRQRLCRPAVLGPATTALAQTGAPTLTEVQKIEALIAHLEGLKDITFVRNGRSYSARTAARFVRGKWNANKAAIKTARDFIEKAASVSSTTGKLYLIRFKDGTEQPSKAYLLAELEKLEKPATANVR